ncbi:glycosyltransferase family 2 protein, partial [Clostridium botulinum]|nr:glycosyltransferase family 2 protein [Clostridium botulinum]
MITLCIIAKNEEYILEKCLIHASNFVDEIIVVDTGSTDKTKEIAYKYTKNVYDFEWCNDFAKARNFSIEKSTNDWIFVLDADEIIETFDLKSVIEFCQDENKQKVGRMRRVNVYE